MKNAPNRADQPSRNGLSRYAGDSSPIVLTHHERPASDGGRRRGAKSGGGRTKAAAGKENREAPDRRGPGGRSSRKSRPQRSRNNGRGARSAGGAEQRVPRSGPPAPVSGEKLPEAFDLFCAYHLGIMADGSHKVQNINEIARRFNVPTGRIKQLLTEYGIDSETMINADFDMALAQLDMIAVPEGIDRREIARNHYEDFLAAPKKTRDWQRELAEDAEANRRTFGK